MIDDQSINIRSMPVINDLALCVFNLVSKRGSVDSVAVAMTGSRNALIGETRQFSKQRGSKQVEIVISKMGESAKRFPTREAVKPNWGKDELRYPSY